MTAGQRRASGLFSLALIIGLGAGGPVVAQGRPDTLHMSCEATRALISTRGAVVVGTGPDLYDRFVASRAFCLPDEITDPVWLPTKDQRQCFAGYRCKRVDYEFER